MSHDGHRLGQSNQHWIFDVCFCNLFFGDTCCTITSKNISFGVVSGVVLSNRPETSLTIQTDYTQRDVVWLVNVFSCLTYDWTLNHSSPFDWLRKPE